ncbi:MAG: hypothetical protein HYX95_03065 [Chloroflexi bacterium]|nr:hypothetical protein [Chloroflexota bacterium]
MHPDPVLTSRRLRLGRARMLGLLEELSLARGPACTVYLPPGVTTDRAEELLGATRGLGPAAGEVIGAAVASSTGVVLFWGEERKVLAVPPFPLAAGFELAAAGYQVTALRDLLLRERTIAVLVLRLGCFGIGVFRGEALLSSKVGTGLVHARHRQGGSSARRFERHRDKQIEYFFGRVCGHARERIGPYIGEVDYLVYGGERNTVLDFRKQCPFLKAADDRVLPRLLNIREPKQPALEAAIHDIWATAVMQWAHPP